MIFLEIFSSIILPIFLIIAAGFFLQRKYKLDLYSLAKLNIYFFVPAFIFVKLYESSISFNMLGTVLFFFTVYIWALALTSSIVSRIFRFHKGMRTAFSNSILLYNSGNYGIPVNDLAFRDPFALSIQTIILTFQNMLVFSYGVLVLRSLNGGKWKALLDYFKMPVFYAMFLAVLFNQREWPIPDFLWTSVVYISDGLIAIALLTLGAQVAQLQVRRIMLSIYLSLTLRLIYGPFLAYWMIILFQLDGLMAKALFLSAAMPTAVNSAIIAQEFNNEREFSTQIVVASTLLSALTVTIVIYFASILF